jgi:hypothetical protein
MTIWQSNFLPFKADSKIFESVCYIIFLFSHFPDNCFYKPHYKVINCNLKKNSTTIDNMRSTAFEHLLQGLWPWEDLGPSHTPPTSWPGSWGWHLTSLKLHVLFFQVRIIIHPSEGHCGWNYIKYHNWLFLHIEGTLLGNWAAVVFGTWLKINFCSSYMK